MFTDSGKNICQIIFNRGAMFDPYKTKQNKINALSTNLAYNWFRYEM